MKVLVIDCATTGLFKWNADPTKPKGFDKSRLLEFAYILYDTKSKVESTSYTTLVKSEGFIIKGIEFHGISDTSNGISMDELLDHLESIVNDFECFVSHNIDFDMKIILSEIYRKGRFQLYNSFVNKHLLCTMKLGTTLSGNDRFISLANLAKLLDLSTSSDRRSMSNARIALDCLIKMINNGNVKFIRSPPFKSIIL